MKRRYLKRWNLMLRDTLKRLDAWLQAHRPDYWRNLLPGATLAELAALRKSLKMPLPRDLRGLLAWHNGQKLDSPARFEQDWFLMSGPRIVAAKRELDAVAESKGWSKRWIPVLDDDAGDFLCLDTSKPKSPVRAFWLGQSDHRIVAPSLATWLKRLVNDAEKGNYVEDEERGTFLRKRAKGS